VFFLGILLTAFTSAWYHLAPGNGWLTWDRLALSFAFMGWLAAHINERISPRAGCAWLALLLVAGPASVVHWSATEAAGAGDLRASASLQFHPALMIPLMLWLLAPRYSRRSDVLMTLGLYALALMPEWLGRAIFTLTGFVSGHTLKRLIAVLRPIACSSCQAGGAPFCPEKMCLPRPPCRPHALFSASTRPFKWRGLMPP
jgi:hypothetical protein